MTDQERDIVARAVPRGTLVMLDRYVELLSAEMARQNLISQATLDTVWTRHISDSLQLLTLATGAGHWIDVGSGAGLPGLIVAICSEYMVSLIEPRRKRAEFLSSTVAALNLRNRVKVFAQRSETARVDPADVISARAVASLDQLFAMAAHFATPSTQWILPKGRSAADEVAVALEKWQAEIRLVPSTTEAGSSIVVASHVRRRGKQ